MDLPSSWNQNSLALFLLFFLPGLLVYGYRPTEAKHTNPKKPPKGGTGLVFAKTPKPKKA